MISSIIWDIDGTVVDTRESISRAYAHVCTEMGLKEDDYTRIFSFVGRRSTLIFDEVHHLTGDAFEQAMALYSGFFQHTGIGLAKLYPGIRELLRELRERGATMTVASARGNAQLHMLFEAVGLTDAFDFVRGTDNNRKAADKPQLVRECIDFMQVPATACVMIGDRIYDIQGGQKCGTRSIGVTYGFGTRQELVACAPDRIVDDVPSLRDALVGGR